MNFESFLADGKVRKGEKDFQKAKALILMSENGLITGINYYGKPVSLKIAEEAKKQSKEVCKYLKQKYINK